MARVLYTSEFSGKYMCGNIESIAKNLAGNARIFLHLSCGSAAVSLT